MARSSQEGTGATICRPACWSVSQCPVALFEGRARCDPGHRRGRARGGRHPRDRLYRSQLVAAVRLDRRFGDGGRWVDDPWRSHRPGVRIAGSRRGGERHEADPGWAADPRTERTATSSWSEASHEMSVLTGSFMTGFRIARLATYSAACDLAAPRAAAATSPHHPKPGGSRRRAVHLSSPDVSRRTPRFGDGPAS